MAVLTLSRGVFNKMKVLSLFDGISCGRVALERAGIEIEKYYASEIDPYAIKISEKNFPDIIHIGSVTEVNPADYKDIDMIIGGSPCQNFSFAGKRNGASTVDHIEVKTYEQYEDLKKQGYQFEGQSFLFWEYVRLLQAIKPKYFLLENVIMSQKWNDVISSALGEIYPECVSQGDMFRSGRLEPVEINSALVSAQNRRRLYWCNWKVEQPKDKGILLKDIIEDGIRCDARNGRGKNLCAIDIKKSPCLLASCYKGIANFSSSAVVVEEIKCGAFRGRNPDNPTSRQAGLPTKQMLEIRQDGKTNTLTTVQKDNVCVQIGTANIKGNDQIKRVYSTEAKGPCLTTMGGGNREPKISEDNLTWRKLTPLECERLQTLPDNYTNCVSNSRRYHGIGNGWTVDVIAHIFKELIK